MTDNVDITTTIVLIAITIGLYQVICFVQRKLNSIMLNPMLLAILCLIPVIGLLNISFEQYYQATQPLHELLDYAVVALGFPLYQHLKTIKYQWRPILFMLMIGVIIAITISALMALVLVSQHDIVTSLALKSITTPIALAITYDLNGNSAITAFSIIIAGLLGAIWGLPWLKFLNVKSTIAQGLAVGAASHVLGTATISKVSYEHAAFGSLSLILSAVITAVIGPILIPVLISLAIYL